MGRTKEFDEASVLKKMMLTFWQNGFANTSIKDLENASGLSSGSLYNCYGGKDELFAAVIVHYMNCVVDPRMDACLRSKDALDGLKTYLRETMEPGNKSRYLGCLIMNAHLNARQLPTSARNLINRCQRQIDQTIENAVFRAQKDGQISQKTDSSILARQISLMLSGRVLRREYSSGDQSAQQEFDASLALLNDKACIF
ncbi:MAG: TetR/AcrR family transcriptional regulator [Pseudomonadota bacterium]